MKNWINRFAMFAVLGSLVCGVLVAGCGGGDGDTDTSSTTVKNTTTTTTDDDTQ